MIAHIDIIPHADASYGINATGGVIKIFYVKKEAFSDQLHLQVKQTTME